MQGTEVDRGCFRKRTHLGNNGHLHDIRSIANSIRLTVFLTRNHTGPVGTTPLAGYFLQRENTP